MTGYVFRTRAILPSVLVLSRITPQARYELARTCTGHDLLSLLLPPTMPHILGVQDEDSRVECDEMAEKQNPADALPTQTAHRESFARACRLTLVIDP